MIQVMGYKGGGRAGSPKYKAIQSPQRSKGEIMSPGLTFTATVTIWLLSQNQERHVLPTDAALSAATAAQSWEIK